MANREAEGLEVHILNTFLKSGEFMFNGKIYKVVKAGKPRPIGGGECKTDVFVLGECNGEELELKISVKIEGKADSPENHLTPERADAIFGENWQGVIERSARNIAHRFDAYHLIHIDKANKTQANSFKLGWRVEAVNKERNLSVQVDLTEQEIKEYFYKGTNLPPNKRNSYIMWNGTREEVPNSGVAEWIIETEKEKISSPQDVIEQMIRIDYYEKPIYLAFKAVNYRTMENDFENRWLGVRVIYDVIDGKLAYELDFNQPFSYKADQLVPILQKKLRELGKFHPSDMDIENDFIDQSKVFFQPGGRIYNPKPTIKKEEVRELLLDRIYQEIEPVINDESDFSLEEIKCNPKKFNVLSLFCGAGGLDLGFELAGLEAVLGSEKALDYFKDRVMYNATRHESIFHTVYANDMFKEALETYENNMPKHAYIHQKDIRRIKEFPSANIVLGGFPCPGFSEADHRLIDDERNFLYIHFIRCLMQVQPEIFVAENVKGMMTLGGGKVFRQIVEDFASAGYRVRAKLLNARDYGVPQIRERVILVGVRNDLDFEYEFPDPTHGVEEGLEPFVSLKDAIGDLTQDPGPYFTGGFSSILMNRNRKKSWDEQSYTIQASGRQAPIHPDGAPMEKVGVDKWIFTDGEQNNRRLSVKEIKRIQTFPDWYEFCDGGNKDSSENSRLDKQYKQIGNSVPVFLARAVAKSISKWAIQYLNKNNRKQPSQLRLF